jgi:hypothetical protein
MPGRSPSVHKTDGDVDATDATDVTAGASPSRFFEIRLATHWPPSARPRWFLRWLLRLVEAVEENKNYRPHLETLDKWWVEFPDGDEEPWREIGFDERGEPVFAGPSTRNYGYWCDTNMTLSDFEQQDPTLLEITAENFELAWTRFFAMSSDTPLSD